MKMFLTLLQFSFSDIILQYLYFSITLVYQHQMVSIEILICERQGNRLCT